MRLGSIDSPGISSGVYMHRFTTPLMHACVGEEEGAGLGRAVNKYVLREGKVKCRVCFGFIDILVCLCVMWFFHEMF